MIPRPPPEPITSTANPLVKQLRGYQMRKYRDQDGVFVVEGLRALVEALDLGYQPRLVLHLADMALASPLLATTLQRLAPGTRVLTTTQRVLEKISERDNPQTVVSVFPQRWTPLAAITAKDGWCWVALDRVRDPGNLGTILRTLDAVAGAGVILIDQCCDPWSWEAVRATMGSVFACRIARATTAEFTRLVAATGWPVVATALDAAGDYRDLPPARPVVLLLGNEQAGLTAALKAVSSHPVRIPMYGRADSLNLAIATGVMLYRLADQTPPTHARTAGP